MKKMSFGQFLTECRIKSGLTQRELANMLFVCESTVSKWEKDKRRPDLDLVSKLSEIFGITESELIRASIDKNRALEKKQARKYRIISGTYNLILLIGFGVALLTCFIVNIATLGTLSWFFIVLASIMLASIILILPKFIKKHRLIIIPLAWIFGLLMLIGIICIYVNGNWFFVAILPILLAYVMIFAPLIINTYFSARLKKYCPLLSIFLSTIFLLIMLLVINIYTYKSGITTQNWFLMSALPIVLYWLAPILATPLVIKIKANKMLKTSIISAIWMIFFNVFDCLILKFLGLAQENNEFWRANLLSWSGGKQISANIMLLINCCLLAIIALFAIIGISKRKNSSKIQE